ncbi:hypothetical protein FN846DRAFT_959499 [Sphaerosporella brunnea]|uniref:Arb2 domain-containing protein n=1 Tax=Sphaerosporella brunnea TaxID=1250544 RepID=A0A5J5EQT1_9PEZI|nr:hypothetical protein FN846DRAFT_959499 [Sphaerosporella brunnea]
MYRRKPKPQTKLPDFPADLQALGLFIHPQADQLRQIEKPDEPFVYYHYGKASSMDVRRHNERMNRRRGEAVNECMRRVALLRLAELDINPVCLPDASAEKHVKILTSPGISTAKRIILIAPDSESSGLGIHCFRHIVDKHIGHGCMEAFVKSAFAADYDAVVIANPATLYWDASTQSAVTLSNYRARELNLKQSFSGAILDSQEHVIPGHEDPEAHLASVLKYLKERMPKDAKLDFVATGYSSSALLNAFAQDWDYWKNNVNAGVLAETGHSIEEFDSTSLRDFIRKRCRNYILHADPIGTYLDPNMQMAVAMFSSGITSSSSEVVPAILPLIFKYFKKARDLDEKAAKLRAGEAVDGDGGEGGELNPIIPIEFSPDMGSAQAEWMAALRKLDLAHETPGWSVPGGDEVDILKQKAEAEEKLFDEWREKARKEGKDLHIFEE